MHRVLSFIFNRFFADTKGISRGWQVFVFLTLLGLAASAGLAWKVGKPGQPPVHRSVYIVLPLMFTSIGGMLWMADAIRRRRFARQLVHSGETVDHAIARDTARNKRVAGAIAAVAGLTLLPFILFQFGVTMWKEYSSLNWTPTNCRVLHVEVDKPWNIYQFRITVAYEMNGVAYDSEVDAPTANSVKSSSEARRIEARYQPGTQHRLYVNPQNPREASLRRGPSVGAVIYTVAGPLLGLMFMVASARFLLRGRLKQETCDPTNSQVKPSNDRRLKRAA